MCWDTLVYGTPIPVDLRRKRESRSDAVHDTRSRHPRWDSQEQNGRSVATPIRRRRLSEVPPFVVNASDRTPAVRVAVEKP